MRSNLLDVGQWPRLLQEGMRECIRLPAVPRPLAAGQVTVALTGSLGDQLFQFAAGYSLARKLGYELRLDLASARRFSVTHLLPLELDLGARIHSRWGSRVIRKAIEDDRPQAPHVLSQNAALEGTLRRASSAQPASFYLHGHWQMPSLFAEQKAALRQLFLTLDAPKVRHQSNDIRTASEPCAICLRRPVYQVERGGLVWSDATYLGYVRSAIEVIRHEVPDATFVVFPADTWSKAKAPELLNALPYTVADDFEEDSVGYIKLLMSCRSFVLAPSSLAWWGAWLADATGPVIAPRLWFPLNEHLSQSIIPTTWQRL